MGLTQRVPFRFPQGQQNRLIVLQTWDCPVGLLDSLDIAALPSTQNPDAVSATSLLFGDA